MSLRIIVIIAITLILPGCSLFFVNGPPRVRPGAPIPATADCTTSYAMPIVDGIFGVASILLIGEILAEDEDIAASEKVGMLAYPVGLFGSGFQGTRRIRACEDFLNTPIAIDLGGRTLGAGGSGSGLDVRARQRTRTLLSDSRRGGGIAPPSARCR